jgi:hypothetical protein
MWKKKTNKDIISIIRRLFKNLPYLIGGLSIAEWTGSSVFHTLWLYVLEMSRTEII